MVIINMQWVKFKSQCNSIVFLCFLLSKFKVQWVVERWFVAVCTHGLVGNIEMVSQQSLQRMITILCRSFLLMGGADVCKSLFGTAYPHTLYLEITQCIERLVIGISCLLILESNSVELFLSNSRHCWFSFLTSAWVETLAHVKS